MLFNRNDIFCITHDRRFFRESGHSRVVRRVIPNMAAQVLCVGAVPTDIDGEVVSFEFIDDALVELSRVNRAFSGSNLCRFWVPSRKVIIDSVGDTGFRRRSARIRRYGSHTMGGRRQDTVDIPVDLVIVDVDGDVVSRSTGFYDRDGRRARSYGFQRNTDAILCFSDDNGRVIWCDFASVNEVRRC